MLSSGVGDNCDGVTYFGRYGAAGPKELLLCVIVLKFTVQCSFSQEPRKMRMAFLDEETY